MKRQFAGSCHPFLQRVVPALGAGCLFALLLAMDGWTAAAARAGAAVLRPPALNHVYVVLDAETFEAIRGSGRMARVLAPADAGLPDYRPPAADSDRLFLRGRTTYLEFFAPCNRFGEPVGKVGIGMGFDAADDLAALEHAWRRAYGADVRRVEQVLRRVSPPVPWYDAVQRDATSANPHLVVWAMTYRPDFAAWQSDGAKARPSTRRADVLAPRWTPGQGLREVTGIALAVPRPLHDMLVEQMRHAGLEHARTADGTRLAGDGWYLRLRPVDDDASALEFIELDAAGPADVPCRTVLGTSVIQNGRADRLTWHFGAAPAVASCPGPDDAGDGRR